MGKIIFVLCLSLFVLLNCCTSSQMIMDDVTCFKIINTEVSKGIKKEFGTEYGTIKEDIKLIMEFYIRENGGVDSIIFVKSNLFKLGVDENLIIDKLMKKRYKCIWDIYYTKELKPDNVVVIFNSKLCD